MNEVTTTVTTIVTSPTVPLTIIDNLFSISHQLFDQYRTTMIYMFSSTTDFCYSITFLRGSI